ncbi:MAG TPA: cohesin domain-containing protein [Candidatus Eisenbacteria bacterium]|jgi:hypothetical protein
MSGTFHNSARGLAAGLCALALALATRSAHADVNVALTPATQTVAPGSDFDVFVDITSAGSAFNGFDLVVRFDPAALTVVPASPTSSQQGCLMTGGCSSACGNTFHAFSTAGDSISVSDVLLCNEVTVTGPGRLYVLHFHAANVQQVTQLDIRRANFYNAGLFVTPVHTASCQVGIGVQVGVGPRTPAPARPLRVEPNPAFGRVNFVSDDDASRWAEAEVMDLQGRIVQRLGPTWLAPRAHFGWDGRDARGARAAAGLYLVTLRHGGQVQHARVILLP